MNAKRICFSFGLLLALSGYCSNDPAWLVQVQNEQRPWAIHGSIVSEHGVQDGWVVFHRGVITTIEANEDRLPINARKISCDGYIFPGLIDTHNHVPWNVLPHWRADHKFNSRYEWLTNSAYIREVNNVFYNNIRRANLEDAALKYGEIRALIGGTTALQSSYATPEPRCLIRTLDSNYMEDSRIPDICATNAGADIKRFTNGLAAGTTRRVFLHIGEGKASDPKAASEFAFLRTNNLVRSGVVIIHGTALSKSELREMAAAGMYLVWSPESNFILYGETAQILEALEAGVIVSLAPDWTITGSDNVLQELKVAWNYSQTHLGGKVTPEELYRMVTINAAKVAGVDQFLGKIAPTFAADLFIAPKLDANPYLSLLQSRPKDIQLVFVDGQPIYGSTDQMQNLVNMRVFATNIVDEIDVDGAKKGIVTLGDPLTDPHYNQHFSTITNILTTALSTNLAKLLED